MARPLNFWRSGRPTRSSCRTAAFTSESGSGESGWKENQTRVRINEQQTGPAELSLCSKRSTYGDSNTIGPRKRTECTPKESRTSGALSSFGREKEEFHRVPLRGGTADKNRGAGRGRASARRSLSSVLRRSAFSRTPRGESAVSGTHRFRENAHCRSRGRDSVRRQPSGDQGGLRGIPALPRNCEIDWFAARISGAPRNAPAYNARSVGRKPPRSHETEFSAVRRD